MTSRRPITIFTTADEQARLDAAYQALKPKPKVLSLLDRLTHPHRKAA